MGKETAIALQKCKELNSRLASLPPKAEILRKANPAEAKAVKRLAILALAYIGLALEKERGLMTEKERKELNFNKVKFEVLKKNLS